jgi:hypothetical protein
MRHRVRNWHFFVWLTAACTASTVQPGRPTTPLPSLPTPVPSPAGTGSWTFNYAPGSVSYQITRNAEIESQSDSGNHREISTNTTHEWLTLEATGDTIYFTAVVDTFATMTQGKIGPVQSVQLPVRLSGSFVGDSIVISADSLAESCNPASSALSADLHNLFVRFPAQLSQGSRWRDSVELKSCEGMIPTTVQIGRSYLVSGESTYEGIPVLVVQRIDTIRAHGEGAQQQHRLTLDASGTGKSLYYLSTRDGRIVRLNSGQDLNLVFTVAGQIHRFKQSSKQDFSYAR